LGFWYGNKLQDVDNYLTHGTNKQIFYKIYKSLESAIGRNINPDSNFTEFIKSIKPSNVYKLLTEYFLK